MLIEVIIITIEVEVLQIIDSNRGQVIRDINSYRNRSYDNEYRGHFKPNNRYENSYYDYGCESTAPARPAPSSQSGRQEGVTMATTRIVWALQFC